MRKLLLLLGIVALFLLAFPAVAFAQTDVAASSGTGDVISTFTSVPALVAILVIGVVTRYGNAFLTSPSAPAWVTGPVAWLLGAAGAIGVYLVDVKGAGTWQAALAVFVSSLVATQFVKAGDPGLEPVLKSTGAGLSLKRAA